MGISCKMVLYCRLIYDIYITYITHLADLGWGVWGPGVETGWGELTRAGG
jgi:hypothetical protein